jgi:hypothetical protein
MHDMTQDERQQLLAAIRATNNPEHPFWVESLKAVQPESPTS